MTTQEHINLLRAEIEKLKAVEPLMISNEGYIVIDDAIKQRKRKLADLEDQAAAEADPWAEADKRLARWKEYPACYGPYFVEVADYVEHLETENKRLEAELANAKKTANVQCDIRYMLQDEAETLKTENAELKAELAKRPVVLYAGNRAYTYEPYTGEKK